MNKIIITDKCRLKSKQTNKKIRQESRKKNSVDEIDEEKGFKWENYIWWIEARVFIIFYIEPVEWDIKEKFLSQ